MSFIVQAQVSIKGEIKNYNNKPLMVKLYPNGSEKVIKSVNTSTSGKFDTNIPVEYNGLIKLELPIGTSIEILTENENINFKSELLGNKIQNIEVIEGKSFSEYFKYNQIKAYNDLKNNFFPQLKNLYTSNDDFYKAINAEESRIQNLNNKLNITSKTVKYNQELQILIDNLKEGNNNSDLNKVLTIIEKDNERLETSGLMSDLIYAYVNGKFASNQNNLNPEQFLSQITNELLDKGNIETARGQNILSLILNMAPEENFPNFYTNFKNKVQSLTCVVTDDLKEKFDTKNNIKVGEIAPNIIFDHSVKGKKSLYEIKSKKKLVVFWASWCPACINEMPYIKDFYIDFKKNGGEIIAISLDYDQDAFNNATKDFGWYNYTDLLKWDSKPAKLYNVNSTPTLFLLDEQNKIIEKVSHVSDLKNK